MSENTCNSLNREIILSHDALIDALSGYIETGSDGAIRHYNSSGNLHRLGGPAIIYANGSERWYQNGRLHREDGPAVVRADGSNDWFLNGICHRLDMPQYM